MLTPNTLSPEALAWEVRMGKVFAGVKQSLSDRDLSGTKFCVWKYLGANTVPMIEALLEAGAEVIAGSSHPNAVSEESCAYLRERGVKVFAHNGMNATEYGDYLQKAVDEKPDYILSSGGVSIIACVENGWSPRAALEGTRTGTNRLVGKDLKFPVFDWNDTQIKNAIEHRFHVAESFWSAFAYLTGMSLFGRQILVVGFGPVGKGICERARNLGGHVVVADKSPIRSVEAVFHGHDVSTVEDGVKNADIVVSVTGRDFSIRAEDYASARDGTVFANAGHSAKELSIDFINAQPRTPARRGVEVFNVQGKEMLLLCRGDAINLASGAGPFGTDMWDIFNALIYRGAHYIHGEMPSDTPPGLHLYPAELQSQVASAFLRSRDYSH